jgi:GTPase involved in cell partitioning and DNA repair
MPELSETAAKIKRRHLLGMIAGTLLFTACSNTENFSIHIAATGTKIEARQVVALVYAQSPDTEINQLLYSGGDLNRVIKQLRDRYPQLKPWLDQGAIGNTASGFMALRDTAQEASLVGHPNVGKSVLFHRLTGTYVTVSNYPGTTVEVSRATPRFDREASLLDTPGRARPALAQRRRARHHARAAQ